MTFSWNDRKPHKYDNMHGNEIIYGLICINNHVLSCLFSMLSTINQVNSSHGFVSGPLTSDNKDILWMDDHVLIMT